jgi:putative acetyltransferase
MGDSIQLERGLSATAEIRALIDELNAELSVHYAAEQRHGLSLDALFEPHIRFFVALADGKPQGCGGVALFPEFAELKRMYVRPQARGGGIAETILERLTQEAAAAGLPMLRLETGTMQLRAIRFYERSGFRTCQAFPPYASMAPYAIATSVFMEKRIGPDPVIKIAPYLEANFDGVDALWREAFPDDPPRNAAKTVIPSKLANQPDLLLVALDGNRIVGSVMAGYDGHRGWINRVAVLKSHRKQGIGASLIQHAEARLRTLGCIKINLQVITSNAAVVEFYRRMGYAVEERISMGKEI